MFQADSYFKGRMGKSQVPGPKLRDRKPKRNPWLGTQSLGLIFDVVGLGLNAVDSLVVVDHYPAFNTKVPLRSHQRSPGGQIATAMVALARLGKQTRYIGKVGDDELGDFQRRSLENDYVECAHLFSVPGAETQTAYIIIDAASGERTIIWHHDQKLNFIPHELSEAIITSGKILHLDGYSVAASIQAAQWARAAGIPVSIDIDEVYPGVENLLPLVDFLIASSEFPALATGEPDPEQALHQLHERYGCQVVAMTLGREGSVALHEGKFCYTPAFGVACVDTTGAGDAFHGGFLYGILEGYSLEDTMRIANAVAALKCRALGARTALPTWSELESLLEG